MTMNTFYRIGPGGYISGQIELAGDAVPPGFAPGPMPALGAGEFAVWNGAAIVATDQPPPTLREGLLARLAARRWQAETAGTRWGEVPVLTERDARAVLTSAIVTGELLNSWPAHWKFADQQFRAVTPDELKAVALACNAHVDAAFAAEAAHIAAIAALPDDALDTYDIHAGWPA